MLLRLTPLVIRSRMLTPLPATYPNLLEASGSAKARNRCQASHDFPLGGTLSFLGYKSEGPGIG